MWIAVTMLGVASAQTKVDLSNQSKSVDFTGAQSTKPFQTGATLPANCGIGQMFFVTSAPSGQNTYGCVAADTWVPQFGSSVLGATGPTGPAGTLGPAGATGPAGAMGPGGSAGPSGATGPPGPSGTPGSTGTVIGVAFNGTPVTTGAANLATDNSTISSTTSTIGGVTTNSFSAGPATALNATLQSGSSPLTFNTSSSSGTIYVAYNSSNALAAYSAGQVFFWVVGTTSTSASPTLNISTLGAKTIVDYQGNALAIGALVNGSTVPITYDGTQIRCLTCGISGGASTSVLPASMGNTGSVSVGATATTLFSTSSVPPLAAGACYQITAVIGGPAGIAHEYIAIDGVNVMDLNNSAGPNGFYSQAWLYCNDAGVQNTQHLTLLFGGYDTANAAGGYANYASFPAYSVALSNINWAASHTISLSVIATSASTVTGFAWRVSQ